jgi:hypothetical protein
MIRELFYSNPWWENKLVNKAYIYLIIAEMNFYRLKIIFLKKEYLLF